MQINLKYMITTEEIIRILENEQLPEVERDNLEILLQERAEQALKEFSKDKKVSVKMVTDIEELIDYVDLSEKMRETGSTDVESLMRDIVEDKVQDLSGPAGWCKYEIITDNNNQN